MSSGDGSRFKIVFLFGFQYFSQKGRVGFGERPLFKDLTSSNDENELATLQVQDINNPKLDCRLA